MLLPQSQRNRRAATVPSAGLALVYLVLFSTLSLGLLAQSDLRVHGSPASAIYWPD
jgi:hypothetical protein